MLHGRIQAYKAVVYIKGTIIMVKGGGGEEGYRHAAGRKSSAEPKK